MGKEEVYFGARRYLSSTKSSPEHSMTNILIEFLLTINIASVSDYVKICPLFLSYRLTTASILTLCFTKVCDSLENWLCGVLLCVGSVYLIKYSTIFVNVFLKGMILC